eukprot:300920-Amphidinium_carterae.1
MKSDVKTSESKNSVQSVKSTRVTVELGPDEEITLAVTKVKKQRLDDVQVDSTESAETENATV